MVAKQAFFLLTLFVVPSVLCLTVDTFVDSTYALAEIIDNDAYNVESINVANTLIEGPKIPEDITDLQNDIEKLETAGQGIPPSNDLAQEDTVTNSFTTLTVSIVGYMKDLSNKATLLILQKSAIEKALLNVKETYFSLFKFELSLLTSKDSQGTLSNSYDNGIVAFNKAIQKYQS